MDDKIKTEVYFDGACPLCKREISLYKKLDSSGAISWVDVSKRHDSVSGLTKDELLKRFHIKNKNGKILSGAEAFFELWREIPGWKWLGNLGRYPLIVNFAEMVYIVFLKVRPFMQRFVNFIEKKRCGQKE